MRSVRNQGPLNVAPRLMPGARLGSYQIEQLLGTGGMGEVYRARDTRLGRDVAIKIISGCHPLDDDRRARFGREARVLASLNHPNIAAIYGFEDAIVEIPPGTQADPQGQSLLIMELSTERICHNDFLADRCLSRRQWK